MKFQFNDGGRAAAGYKGVTGDCACRALAIAAEIPYQQAYDLINKFSAREHRGKRKRGMSNARTGVHSATMRRVMGSLGWQWVPTMAIGQGCKVHLHDGELPPGRLIVAVSRHYTTVIDGVVHDIYDPQRDVHTVEPDRGQELRVGQWRNINGICSVSRRCVYGYWHHGIHPPAAIAALSASRFFAVSTIGQ